MVLHNRKMGNAIVFVNMDLFSRDGDMIRLSANRCCTIIMLCHNGALLLFRSLPLPRENKQTRDYPSLHTRNQCCGPPQTVSLSVMVLVLIVSWRLAILGLLEARPPNVRQPLSPTTRRRTTSWAIHLLMLDGRARAIALRSRAIIQWHSLWVGIRDITYVTRTAHDWRRRSTRALPVEDATPIHPVLQRRFALLHNLASSWWRGWR